MLEILGVKSFLLGQLEMYKIKFSNTSDRGYLDTMNNISKTMDVLNILDRKVSDLAIQNRDLLIENKKLKEVINQ